jgi:hypothetical protein
MAINLRHILPLPRHADHAHTPPSLRDQLAAVQAQLKTLTIDAVQGQVVESANLKSNIWVDHADGDFGFRGEIQQSDPS